MDLDTARFAKIVETLHVESSDAGSERRRATRTAVHAKVAVGTLGPGRQVTLRFTAMTHDLSTSGVGLLQTLPLQPGTALLIELPEGRKPALLVGVVRHLRAAANGIFAVGVAFTGDAPPDLADRWAHYGRAELDRVRASVLGGGNGG